MKKKYIKPIMDVAFVEIATVLLAGSIDQTEQLSKKNNFSMFDDSDGFSDWPKQKTVWDE